MADRIKLKDNLRKRLFDRLTLDRNVSLKELSREINCGYSGLKNWRTGKRLIPEDAFHAFLTLADFDISSEKDNFVKYPSNWGAALGGVRANDKPRNLILKKMAHARKFRKHTIVLPQMNNDLWELFGVFLGDGCISKTFSKYENRWLYLSILTGHMKDDLDYYDSRILPILKLFNCKAGYQFRPEYNVITIRINNKKIFTFLKNLGMPVGKKKDKLRISKEIFFSSKETKAAVLRGLLDTDGHMFARKDEGYRYPYIKITSASRLFRKDIKKLIREFGLPAYEHGEDIQVRGSANVKQWMGLIGTSHPLNMKRYNTWLNTGVLLPKKGLVV